MATRVRPAALDEPEIAATLALFQHGQELTRLEVAERTGWARVTVTSRIERLLADGLLEAYEDRSAGRGRPATRYRLANRVGGLLVADVGASGMLLARCDLAGAVLNTHWAPSVIGDGPEAILRIVRNGWKGLLRDADAAPPWGVAIGLPGPVEHPAGRVVDPPIMTGWDGYDVSGTLAGWYGTPALVENDANALAIGEAAVASEAGERLQDLLVVKVGTGVGMGIISGGRVLRGAAGAAGDLGHTQIDRVHGDEQPLCHCGKSGCVEAYAGGWALVRDAQARGLDVGDLDGFLRLLAAGDPIARALTIRAGRVVGNAIATAVSLLNPQQVILGGRVGLAGDHLVAGVRERVYARSLPLATRNLRIGTSTLGRHAGVRGLAAELGRKVLFAAAGT